MKRTKHVTALAVLAVALGGCFEDEQVAVESRTLQQMLALGANQILIDKYDAIGHDSSAVLKMLEAVGRDGEEQHPLYVEELLARRFVMESNTTESTQTMSRGMVRRRAM